MKKVLSLVLVFAMVLGSFSFAFAAAPSDVAGTEYENAVERLSTLGVLTGYPDGTFRPNNTITRAEFSAAVVRVLNLEAAAKASKGATEFTDVPAEHWASGYVNIASKMGYVKGMGDGTFAPEAPITYEQAVTLVMRALGYEEAAQARGGYPYGYLILADQEGLTDEVDGVQGAPAPRGLVAQLLDNALEIPMMVQVGYGSETKWVQSGTEDTDEVYLLDELGFDKVTERVVAVNADDNEIELEEEGDLEVSEDFDFEAVFGNEVTVWLDGDTVVLYTVEDEALFDAVEFDADEEELTLVDADETYEFAEDAILFANGDEVKDVEDLDAAYDYAKVVLNDDDEVVFLNAYNWDHSLVVEEADAEEIVGYDENAADRKLDAEDYTIVKDGKTLNASDLEEGDILYYNEDAGYAEVYAEEVIGVVEEVYDGEFDLDDETYDIAGTYLEAGEDVEAIDVLTEKALEKMKDTEEEVKVLLDRKGNVRHIVGELGEEDTTTVAGYVIRDVQPLSLVRSDSYNVDVVTEEGEFVEYDVEKSSFADVNDNDSIDFADDIDIINEGDLVEITFEEDGDIKEVVKVDVKTETLTLANDDDDIDVVDDKYTQDGYRLTSDVIVFNVENYTDDTDDIEVSKLSELEFDTIKAGTVYADEDDYVTYIVVTKSDEEVVTETGLITDVKKLSNGDYRVWININGEEKYDDVDTKYTAGTIVEVELNEEEDTFKKITPLGFDEEGTITIESLKSETFTVSGSVYDEFELADEGFVFDITDLDDIEEIELDDVEDGAEVEVYFDGTSKRMVKFLLVTKDAPKDGEDKDVSYDAEVAYDFDATTDSTIRLTIDGKLKSYVINSDSLILDATGDTEVPTTTIMAGSKVTFVLIEGTDIIDVIKVVK